MSSNKCLGIFLGSNAIVAVEITRHHHQFEFGAANTINIPEKIDINSLHPLTQMHSKGMKIAMALAGTYYKSHPHHSEFHDSKQIDQVLRYDIEDAFAVDAEKIILCYEKQNVSERGCDLIVNVADKEEIAAIVNVFESAAIDPFSIEPDINAWLHYIKNCETEYENQALVLLGIADGRLFIAVIDNDGKIHSRRSIPISNSSLDDTVSRELKRTFSVLPSGLKPQTLLWHSENITPAIIEELALSRQMQAKRAKQDNLAVAIAAGAGIALMSHQSLVNFRNDNMQPKAMLKMKSIAQYSLSAAVCLLFIVLFSLNYQKLKTFEQANSDMPKVLKQINETVFDDSGNVNITGLRRKIDTELTTLKGKSSGAIFLGDKETANGNLLLLLNALNELDDSFKLFIEEIDISKDQIRTFRGSVLSAQDYEYLSNQLRAAGLEFVREDIDNLGIRIDFNLQIRQNKRQ